MGAAGPYRTNARVSDPPYYVEGPWVVCRHTGNSLRARWVIDIISQSEYEQIVTFSSEREVFFSNVSAAELRRLLTDAMDNDPECVKNLG